MNGARSQRLQIILRALILLACAGLLLLFSGRQRLRWDLSQSRQFSLSAETTELLQALPATPSITLYVPDREPERGHAAALLGACQALRPGLDWSIVDPGREPARAMAEGVRETGGVIVAAGDASERFQLERGPTGDFKLTELDLARAFLALARGGGARLRIVQGPGLRPLEGAEGLGAMLAVLELDGQTVEPWWPLREDGAAVPADTDILILAGPHRRLPARVLSGLEDYLAAGGALFLMLDPVAEMADSSKAAGLEALLASRGIRAGPGFIVDLGEESINLGKGFEVPVVSRYAQHPVTQRFQRQPAPTCFPLARALEPMAGAAVPPQGLLQTDARSFEERGAFDGSAHLDEGVDPKGPFVLAAASDSSATGGGPLLVVGDSHFVGNDAIDWYGNAELLLAGIRWLGREGLRPELTLPEAPARLLIITARGRRLYGLVSLLILPLILFSTWPLRLIWRRLRLRRGAGAAQGGP